MIGDLRSAACLRDVETRSISAENPDGARGGGGRATEGTGGQAARHLGQGWKVSPFVMVPARSTFEFANIDGPGTITHIWFAMPDEHLRSFILRMYWDGDPEPAVEVPIGDFFCQGSGVFAPVASIPIAVNSHGGLNAYWPMPFARHARLTVENVTDQELVLFYQVDYELGGDTSGLAYLQAQWRRSNLLPASSTHVLLEGVEGRGHYIGTAMTWASKSDGWWGEGEIKFYLDDDGEFPSICGTGTEDYFGGAWCFAVDNTYVTYSGPFLGFFQAQVSGPGFVAPARFGMYRWHLPDPITFKSRLGRVDIQALGWQDEGRYRMLEDDIASTAFFYLDRTSAARGPSPTQLDLRTD